MHMEIKKHRVTEKHTAFALMILFNFCITNDYCLIIQNSKKEWIITMAYNELGNIP